MAKNMNYDIIITSLGGKLLFCLMIYILTTYRRARPETFYVF